MVVENTIAEMQKYGKAPKGSLAMSTHVIHSRAFFSPAEQVTDTTLFTEKVAKELIQSVGIPLSESVLDIHAVKFEHSLRFAQPTGATTLPQVSMQYAFEQYSTVSVSVSNHADRLVIPVVDAIPVTRFYDGDTVKTFEKAERYFHLPHDIQLGTLQNFKVVLNPQVPSALIADDLNAIVPIPGLGGSGADLRKLDFSAYFFCTLKREQG